MFTDHNPLVPISEKPIIANPARCQRLLLRLQKYDFKLVYKKGKDHTIPDTLSRAALPTIEGHDEELEQECEFNVHMVMQSNIIYSDEMKKRLVQATQEDKTTSTLIQYVLNGWPDVIKECDPHDVQFWSFKDIISLTEDFVLMENRIIIPKALRSEILTKIHSGHQGRVRSKALARQAVFWPNINADIDNVVNKCEQCLQTRKLPDKIVLLPHEVPQRPFEKVAADILTVLGSKYQIVVDYFSKWIELVKLPNNPTSMDLINHFTDVFARFWFPNISFSDREPIYKSTEMKQFCEMYGISKNFSSAYHSQSNGQVERAVGHIKNLIKRCNGNILKVRLCLLDYHATPLDSNLGSPHSILMNRNVRTRIPMLEKNLITKTDQDNREILLDRHQKGANYYNKTASDNVKLFKQVILLCIGMVLVIKMTGSKPRSLLLIKIYVHTPS